jgi:hypothetical protein
LTPFLNAAAHKPNVAALTSPMVISASIRYTLKPYTILIDILMGCSQMNKKLIFFQIVFICNLILFPSISIRADAFNETISRSIEMNPAKISKADIMNLIKQQGAESNYYFDGLSYELINVDSDEDLEIIAKIDGAVHIGNFFLCDKSTQGNYSLVAERNWKVENVSVADQLDYKYGIKLNVLAERGGGSGLDVYTAHLWYLKDGKFVEAWKWILKERSVFQYDLYLSVGGYRYAEEFSKLFAWSSDYLTNVNTNTLVRRPTTTISVYKFDGNKFILESEEKYEHTTVFPIMQHK